MADLYLQCLCHNHGFKKGIRLIGLTGSIGNRPPIQFDYGQK